jgi:peroxiredoxin
MQEMEQFQKLYEKYHEDGFEIYGISVDNPRSSSKIKPTVASKGWTFPILLDPDKEVLKKFGGKQKIPYLVVVSPDGDIVAIHEGYKAGNEKVIEAEILPFIGEMDSSGEDAEESENTTE